MWKYGHSLCRLVLTYALAYISGKRNATGIGCILNREQQFKMIEYIDSSLDEEFKRIDSLTWWPFIGQKYFHVKFKTLVVGESHYVPVGEDPDFYNDKTWTRHFILKEGLQIKPWNKSESKNNLVRNIERTLDGRLNNDFWENVAYFNLIQRLLPSIKGQDRPTYEDIKNGLNTFKEVIRLVNPDKIVFCGTEAAKYFKNLISDGEFRIDEFKCPKSKINGAYPKSFNLKFNEKNCICYFIKHPSKYYSADRWREFIFEK